MHTSLAAIDIMRLVRVWIRVRSRREEGSIGIVCVCGEGGEVGQQIFCVVLRNACSNPPGGDTG